MINTLNKELCLVHFQKEGNFHEGVPIALVNEVLKALPYDQERLGWDARNTLLSWIAVTSHLELSLADLLNVEEQLAAFAHGTETESGEVGRLPQGAGGRVVGQDQFDSTPLSSATVLALAIRRLRVIRSLGSKVIVVPQMGMI